MGGISRVHELPPEALRTALWAGSDPPFRSGLPGRRLGQDRCGVGDLVFQRPVTEWRIRWSGCGKPADKDYPGQQCSNMDSSEESLPVGWLEMRPALGPSLDGASVSAQMLL